MGMGPCPSCGNSIDLAAAGCPFCGASLEGLAERVQAGAASAPRWAASGFLTPAMGGAAALAFVLGIVFFFGVSLLAGLAAFGFALVFLGLGGVLQNQQELAKLYRG